MGLGSASFALPFWASALPLAWSFCHLQGPTQPIASQRASLSLKVATKSDRLLG